MPCDKLGWSFVLHEASSALPKFCWLVNRSHHCVCLARAPRVQWAPCLAAGTDTPLWLSFFSFKAPSPAVSSHCLAMLRPGRCGTVPTVPHGDSWQQLQQSGRCHVRLQHFSRHVNAVQFTALYWRFASAQSSGGQLMSGPWPSGPNYGFHSRPLRARFRTWLRLPDNCV